MTPKITNRSALLAAAPPGPRREARRLALDMADAALAAVDARACTARALDSLADDGIDLDGCVIFAFGKASVEMTRAALARVRVRTGIVLALAPVALEPLVVHLAGHPVPLPDAAERGDEMLALARSLGPDDTALCLVSGGGSSMLEAPVDGVSIAAIAKRTHRGMADGMDIAELNALRRTLSRVKGGRLAEAIQPARIVNVILSDVPGGPLSVVASGPTLREGQDRILTVCAADNRTAVLAAASAARGAGLSVFVVERPLTGIAREVGAHLASLGDPAADAVVAGGETTVMVRGDGMGGRNQELALAALCSRVPGLTLTLATDGVDGRSDAAGALADAVTRQAGRAANAPESTRSWLARLNNNDSNGLFRQLGATLQTGPTGTNVADVLVHLRDRAGAGAA